MSAMNALIDAGLTLSTVGDSLVVRPANLLTDDLRDLIRSNKPALWSAARAAEELTDALVLSINQCCDMRGDNSDNRDGLIANAIRLPAAHQAEMREHFEAEAARWARATGKAP